MDSALDVATDVLTTAFEAKPHREYCCFRCQAPVRLRSGEVNRPHFAHAVGEADPDCEHYFPTTVQYTGRRPSAGHGATQSATNQYGDLFFDLAASGPELSIWFPPTNDDVWSGQITVEAHLVSRVVTAPHLRNGHLVTFALGTGQWTVGVVGAVPESYQLRIGIGRDSLESGLNLFDATQSPGRRLGPSDVIRLGDAVWLLTREELRPDSPIRSSSDCALRIESAGWYVYLVELPDEASRDDVAALSQALQRRVRLPRAVVWIEHPWPLLHLADGTGVYTEAEDLEIHADRPLDIAIRAVDGDALAAQGVAVTRLSMTPRSGNWHLLVNGARYDTFSIASGRLTISFGIRVTFDSSAPCDISRAQQCLERLGQDGVTPRKVRLEWASVRIGRLLRINTKPVAQLESGQCEIALAETISVTAGVLGGFSLVHSSSARPPRALYAKATWLLSLRHPAALRPRCGLKVPPALLTDPTFSQLATATWPLFLRPQVTALERALGAHR